MNCCESFEASKIEDACEQSNPTGSAAVETKVAAACLTLLLTRRAPLCLGAGTLRLVHLQAGHLGLRWRTTDDLVLEASKVAGKPMKAALQAKRTFVLSASDTEYVQTLLGALGDFRNADLHTFWFK